MATGRLNLRNMLCGAKKALALVIAFVIALGFGFSTVELLEGKKKEEKT